MRVTRAFAIPMLVGALILSGRRAWAQEAGQGTHGMKVAVVCTDAGGQQAQQIAALLEAELTGDKAFGLVERQAVGAVLKEQTLQALSDSAGTAKFGRLVGADLLLFCEGVPGSKPPLMRVRVVESADGVVLLDELEELQTLTGEAGPLRRDIEAAVAKAGVPARDRKFVGVVDVASEEPGKSLDPLAATLGVLLRVDLAKSANVVVLEREQLQRLIAERGLSGMEVKLRAATRLLEVKMKRAASADAGEKLEISVSISDMSGGTARELQVSGPRGDLPALRRDLNAAIVKALAVPLPPNAAGDLRAEAKTFHDRAAMLLAHGYLKEALRLGETAYTLDPKMDYFDIIARCCHDLYGGVNPLLGDDDAVGYTHVGTLEELNAALLLAQMHLDASGRVAASIPANMTDPKGLHWGPLFTDFDMLRPMFPLPDPPQTPEQKIVAQLLNITDQEYRLWSEVYKAHHWSLDSLDYLTVALGPYLARDGTDYCNRAEAAYEEFEGERAAWLKNQSGPPPVYPDLSVTLADMLRSGTLGNVAIGDVRPLVIWLTKQDDPLLRVQGWNSLARLEGGEARQRAARQALDALFRAKPRFASPLNDFAPDWLSERYRRKFFGDVTPVSFLPINYIYGSIYFLSSDNQLAGYTKGLLDELVKRGDPLPLLRWTRQTTILLNLDPKDDLALSSRMQKLLKSKPVPPEFAEDLGILESNLTHRIRICKMKLGLIPDKSNRWDDVKVRPIQYQAAPAGAPHLIWVSVDRTQTPPDLLMLWRSDPIGEHAGRADFALVVGRMSLQGGPIAEIARGKFSGPVYHFYGNLRGFRITSVLPTPGGIFISDFRRGLLLVKNGRITEWTGKDGLASDQIWSLAWVRGTLYAGCDNGFMTIDPHTAKCRILSSGKSPNSNRPLDGGTPYRIANILPAPDQKSLWLAVGGDATRMGLWRYDLASGTFAHVVGVSDDDPELPVDKSTGPSLTWHDGKLLMIMRPAGVCLQTPMGLLDAQTGLWLKTYYGERADLMGVVDSFPDERNGEKVFQPIAYTPQHRMALTSIGVIRENGDAVDPALDQAFYYNWELEEPVDPGENEVFLRNSRIATPELCRKWDTIEEVGAGFVAASYSDGQAPALWFLTPPKELPLPPLSEFDKH